jgi:hypothetical protein
MEHLDLDTRLGMMGTSRRFYSLAQYNQNFTKYFKVEISSEFLNDPKNCEALQTPLRFFGVVVLKELHFDQFENHFRIIKELFEKIGSHIDLLVFCEMKLSESHLLQLLAHTGNVRALYFQSVALLTKCQVATTETPRVLEKLEFLRCEDGKISAINFNDIVPDSLEVLEIGDQIYIDMEVENDWTDTQRYFGKQKQLKRLWLAFFFIEEFRYEPELNQIESLKMKRVQFKGPSAFQDFSNFIRAQKNMQSVELDIFDDEYWNGNNYTELCTCLLKRNKLKSFKLMSERIPELLRTLGDPIPTLENLELYYGEWEDFDCSQIARLFPNLSSLLLDYAHIPDIRPLNSLNSLRTLSLDSANNLMIEQLDVKGLRRIIISSFPDVDIEVWERFTRKHGDLRHLKLFRATIEQLQIVLANLEKLEFLSVSLLDELSDDTEKLAIETIGKLYEKLDKIEITATFENPEVTADFKMSFPGIPIEAEYGMVTVRKSIDGSEDRHLWSRKNLKSFYKNLR